MFNFVGGLNKKRESSMKILDQQQANSDQNENNEYLLGVLQQMALKMNEMQDNMQ